MEDMIVRYIDLPCRTKGYVRRDSEGDYNVYINSRLSYDTQQDAIKHEMNHIKNGDFDSNKSITDIEHSASHKH